MKSAWKGLGLLFCLVLCSQLLMAQIPTTAAPGQPTTLANTPQRDTNANKSNTKKWKDQQAVVTYRSLNSSKTLTPDTSLHTFDRRPFTTPWYRDLGNLGSPSRSLVFTPEDRLGPTLGYHVFDAYRFFPDSLYYYNTTRPYSSFTYNLGSKLEQRAEIFHTQNIKPNWNFAFGYRKTNSPGYYKIQRVNDDNGYLTTNYQGKNKHYELYAALVYNKQQQDENGGITTLAELDSSQYSDRKTIGVNFQNDYYSTVRSSVTNLQRDFSMLLQHSYTWGKGDTLYNEDSTKYTYRLTPRFRITHKMELSTEKHEYKDMSPSLSKYTPLYPLGFDTTGLQNAINGVNNNGFFIPVADSVLSRQKWFWLDNRLLLNGFLGKAGKQLAFSAGAGTRIDEFITEFGTGRNTNNILSNYFVGEIKKEALEPGQFFYQANGQFFLTGDAAGDFLLHASAGRDFNGNWGRVVVGFKQQLNSAPYSYTVYENEYLSYFPPKFDKESVTQIYGVIESPKIRLAAGVSNYLVDNYIYINPQLRFDQYKIPFSLTEIWGRKVFSINKFFLDNELVYQQRTGNAPVNIPSLLGKNRLSYETALFKKALKIATGIEIRYNTGYDPAGYDPFFNKFYYQNSYFVNNFPEGAVFFNFRIKQFRAYIMGDQLQQLFRRNLIIAPGYAAQDAMIRFGFTWVLIN